MCVSPSCFLQRLFFRTRKSKKTRLFNCFFLLHVPSAGRSEQTGLRTKTNPRHPSHHTRPYTPAQPFNRNTVTHTHSRPPSAPHMTTSKSHRNRHKNSASNQRPITLNDSTVNRFPHTIPLPFLPVPWFFRAYYSGLYYGHTLPPS